METCCFCGRQFPKDQMTTLTPAGAKEPHPSCSECSAPVKCVVCGRTLPLGDTIQKSAGLGKLDEPMCEVCWVGGLDKPTS